MIERRDSNIQRTIETNCSGRNKTKLRKLLAPAWEIAISPNELSSPARGVSARAVRDLSLLVFFSGTIRQWFPRPQIAVIILQRGQSKLTTRGGLTREQNIAPYILYLSGYNNNYFVFENVHWTPVILLINGYNRYFELDIFFGKFRSSVLGGDTTVSLDVRNIFCGYKKVMYKVSMILLSKVTCSPWVSHVEAHISRAKRIRKIKE